MENSQLLGSNMLGNLFPRSLSGVRLKDNLRFIPTLYLGCKPAWGFRATKYLQGCNNIFVYLSKYLLYFHWMNLISYTPSPPPSNSLLMLCVSSNHQQPFSYHMAAMDLSVLMFCPFSHGKKMA